MQTERKSLEYCLFHRSNFGVCILKHCKYANCTEVVLFVVGLNLTNIICFRPYHSTMEHQNRMLCRNICRGWRAPRWSTRHCKLIFVIAKVKNIVGLYNLYLWYLSYTIIIYLQITVSVWSFINFSAVPDKAFVIRSLDLFFFIYTCYNGSFFTKILLIWQNNLREKT